MDCKEEFLIYAKTGAIFAKCDGNFTEKKEKIIYEKLSENFPSSYSDDIKNEINKIRNDKKEKVSNRCLSNLIKETEKYLDNLDNDDKKKNVINEIAEFIEEIIQVDGVVEEEIKLFYNWKKIIYKKFDQKWELNEDEKRYKNKKNIKEWTIVFLIIFFIILLGSIFILIGKYKNKEALEAFPLSSYTEKMLQFKEIDFSKVLIYGTETEALDRDSLLLYFTKGTAILRFRGLNNLSIDSKATTKNTLVLNYDINNQTELPIDVDIIYDESKCRFIDSIEATTIKNSPLGKSIKGISTIAGTAAGGYVGNAIGGLFGLEGQIIGLASGAVLGGVGSYIASANFVKKTKIVKDNSSSTIRDMLEDAKPIIAAQLLQDETVTQNKDKNELDMKGISEYYKQQLADILTTLICNDENNKWKNVKIRF